MKDIFNRIKNEISLLTYIQNTTQSSIKPVGSGKFRVSPCPLCDHKECFTIFPDHSYHCFSCEKSGDVIHFERHFKSLSGNLQAAKSLAEIHNINLDESSNRKPAKSSKQKKTAKTKPSNTSKKTTSEKSRPKIEKSRATALRELVADFYHEQLLGNQEALDYQTKVRGHSLGILQTLWIGHAAGDVIGHCTRNGYSIQELEDIGIARKRGRGYGATIRQGMTVFPHIVNGAVGYFSIKDPKKKLQYQVLKKCAAKNWLCYNQDALKGSGPVVICEGENDLISLMDKAGQDSVIATLGNFNTSEILSYLKENASGKTFYLCFDRDEAGEKYTAKYASAVIAGGGQVKVIEIPEPYGDIDDVLRAAADPVGSFQQLLEAAKAPAEDELEQTKDSDRPYKFESFEMLGELRDERVVSLSHVNSKVYTTTLRDLTFDKLIQIGGDEVAYRVSRNAQEGKIMFRTLKVDLIIQASKRQLNELEWLGQGMHSLKGGKLLIVEGGNSYLWDGSEFARQEHPLIQDVFIEWQPGNTWIDFEAVRSRVLQMDKKQAFEIVAEVTERFYMWGFSGSADYMLISGWVLAQVVQAVWAWRPHLWLSGSQGSGKTLMVEFMEALGGGLALRCEGQTLTEPGLRQSISNDSALVSIDEFEASDHRNQIIQFLRSANRGGFVRKGSSDQKAVHFRVKHMIFCCSIETGFQRAAENSRFLVIETKKDPSKSPKIPNVDQLEKLRVDCFAYALWAVFQAKSLVGKMGGMKGYDNRFIESLMVPLSMIAVSLDGNPEEELKKLLQTYLDEWNTRQTGGYEEDEDRLIRDILFSAIRVPETEDDILGQPSSTKYVERTISQLIADGHISVTHQKSLEACGIKVEADYLFLHPEQISRSLLKATQWRDLNIRSILMRIPDVEAVRDHLAGRRVRGIKIPKGCCELECQDQTVELF